VVQKAHDIFEIICPNLNPDGGVGRTQKQKALKQFVNCISRIWLSFAFSNTATLTHGRVFLEKIIIQSFLYVPNIFVRGVWLLLSSCISF
jgi:hypothetical protein